MRSSAFILADLMVALGRDPYHAACTEMWLMVMIIAPVLVLAPYPLPAVPLGRIYACRERPAACGAEADL